MSGAEALQARVRLSGCSSAPTTGRRVPRADCVYICRKQLSISFASNARARPILTRRRPYKAVFPVRCGMLPNPSCLDTFRQGSQGHLPQALLSARPKFLSQTQVRPCLPSSPVYILPRWVIIHLRMAKNRQPRCSKGR